jgi:hypothetical protein
MSEATVRIYESELSLIVHETSKYETTETGGSIFGLWTNIGNPTILLASRPGEHAIHTDTHFEQDAGTHRMMEELMVHHHGVQSVGLWHSHHGLGLHELSGGDIRRTMQFAQRNQRKLFCDLLCYFAQRSRSANEPPEVTIKPYVYYDAANGRRRPTSIVVLPGLSPLRGALFEQGFRRDVEERLRFALAPPPERWQLRCRTARSVEQGQDGGEDRSVSSAGGFWPFHRKKSETGDTDEVPASASPAESRPEIRNAIPNLEAYIHNYVEPALRDIPRGGVRCELEPIFNGQALRMTLTAANRSMEHELDLGWDGAQPVVTRFVERFAQRPGEKEHLGDGEVLGMREVLQTSFNALGKLNDRR